MNQSFSYCKATTMNSEKNETYNLSWAHHRYILFFKHHAFTDIRFPHFVNVIQVCIYTQIRWSKFNADFWLINKIINKLSIMLSLIVFKFKAWLDLNPENWHSSRSETMLTLNVYINEIRVTQRHTLIKWFTSLMQYFNIHWHQFLKWLIIHDFE